MTDAADSELGRRSRATAATAGATGAADCPSFCRAGPGRAGASPAGPPPRACTAPTPTTGEAASQVQISSTFAAAVRERATETTIQDQDLTAGTALIQLV